ncbi:hypothetical protein NX059_001202 [Plenodomus lindquistii]|nr:hypothetical protein NX059_001202 [Plenodomus lindquistii]
MSSPSLRSQGEFFMAGITPVAAQPEEDCPICMEPLAEDSVQVVACRHTFHTTCLHPWLNSSGARSRTCPCCRRELFRGPSVDPRVSAELDLQLRIEYIRARVREIIETGRIEEQALEDRRRQMAMHQLNGSAQFQYSTEGLAPIQAAARPVRPERVTGAELRQARERARAAGEVFDLDRFLRQHYGERDSVPSMPRDVQERRTNGLGRFYRAMRRDARTRPVENRARVTPESDLERFRQAIARQRAGSDQIVQREQALAHDTSRRVARQYGLHPRQQNQPPS